MGVFFLATFTYLHVLLYFEIYRTINIELTYFSTARALATSLFNFALLNFNDRYKEIAHDFICNNRREIMN